MAAYAAFVLFDASVSDLEGMTVARVVGDVDLATLPRLQAVLERLEGPEVAVDLRAVDWFDPVCLGALLAADLRARRRDAKLTVAATGSVADLLCEVGLDRVLDLVSELRGS